jgi:hypothetical protein
MKKHTVKFLRKMQSPPQNFKVNAETYSQNFKVNAAATTKF